MKWNFFKSKPKQKKSTRSFAAAMTNRLTNDFLASDSILQDMSYRVPLRARARELSKNNEYVRKYLSLVKNNVIGPNGIQLSMQVQTLAGANDVSANKMIEDSWHKWSKIDNCDVTGQYNLIKIYNLVIEAFARDGEALIWIRRGAQFGDFNFQLQVLDAEYLDDTYSTTHKDGARIRDGVEFNQFGKPIAYHILSDNPNDTLVHTRKRYRVLAKDIIHFFDPEYAAQYRGITKLAAAMLPLHNLGKYREAELMNARISASKQGFFTQHEGSDDFQGDDEDERIDESLNLTREISPGTFDVMPKGWGFEKVDWSSPGTDFDTFNKAMLRGISAALGVSYNSLNTDLESVNYSSARFGAIEDQSSWRTIQNLFVSVVTNRIFSEWLKIQILNKNINLPISGFDRFNNKKWIRKSWKSVDPGKDANANALQMKMNTKTRADILAEDGKDFEETILQIAKEKAFMEKYDVQDRDFEIIEANNVNTENINTTNK